MLASLALTNRTFYVHFFLELNVGLDVKSGAVFCSVCEEFIFDGALDKLYRSTRLVVEAKETHFICTNTFTHPMQL